MFIALSSLRGQPGSQENLTIGPILAGAADIILALALATIGGIAHQYSCFPIELRFALMGAGVAYFIGSGVAIGLTFKFNRDAYKLRVQCLNTMNLKLKT